MINGIMTLSGAWHKLRYDPILRFLGGCFFVTGMLLMAYNAYRTITAPKGSLEPVAQPA